MENGRKQINLRLTLRKVLSIRKGISGLFEKSRFLRDFSKFKKISDLSMAKSIRHTLLPTNLKGNIFRTRISKAFEYEPIVKREKFSILF